MTRPAASVPGSRIVAVTGASQGLWRAYVLRFAREGHRVVAIDMKRDALDVVTSEAKAFGADCLSLVANICEEASVAQAAAAVDRNFGRCDVLINNAAIISAMEMRPFEEIPLHEWNRVLEVNITGTFLMTRALVPLMRRNRWGRVMNVSSAAVAMGRPNYLHYATSKAAVIGMTRSMAHELGADGITVNALLPGSTDTEVPSGPVTPQQKRKQIAMRCIQREGWTDDLERVVSFLASDDSSLVTGQSFAVDGGYCFV